MYLIRKISTIYQLSLCLNGHSCGGHNIICMFSILNNKGNGMFIATSKITMQKQVLWRKSMNAGYFQIKVLHTGTCTLKIILYCTQLRSMYT